MFFFNNVCLTRDFLFIFYLEQADWNITDVVMYTATNKTILTFFHSHDKGNHPPFLSLLDQLKPDLDDVNKVCYGSRHLDVSHIEKDSNEID